MIDYISGHGFFMTSREQHKPIPLRWKETNEFTKARKKALSPSMTVRVWFFSVLFSLIFCFGLWGISGTVTSYSVVILASIVLSAVVAIVFGLAMQAPKKVKLTEERIFIDRDSFMYEKLNRVRLGYVEYGNREFLVAVFVIGHTERIVGIPNEALLSNVKDYLGNVGVLVE